MPHPPQLEIYTHSCIIFVGLWDFRLVLKSVRKMAQSRTKQKKINITSSSAAWWKGQNSGSIKPVLLLGSPRRLLWATIIIGNSYSIIWWRRKVSEWKPSSQPCGFHLSILKQAPQTTHGLTAHVSHSLNRLLTMWTCNSRNTSLPRPPGYSSNLSELSKGIAPSVKCYHRRQDSNQCLKKLSVPRTTSRILMEEFCGSWFRILCEMNVGQFDSFQARSHY